MQLLLDEFGAAHSEAASGRAASSRRSSTAAMVRGCWVDEPHTAKGYVPDFDLLVVVSNKDLADRAAHRVRADERLIEEKLAGRLRTPVNFIVHSLQEVNDGLAHRRFVFMDIARDGTALYSCDDRERHGLLPKTPQANLELAGVF
ncbi:hypothetical protein [Novosphingobium sp. SG707]|uniref:hypothetical protein n=1 Tax=Novosphingobium sp. SG707 TaxID=2586996 RepID=UPI00180FC68D|nr:hypothetical protein [Novosphingobium sp. SG707]